MIRKKKEKMKIRKKGGLVIYCSLWCHAKVT
jgi:hypothetical protein